MPKKESLCPPEPETVAHAASATLNSRKSVEAAAATLELVRSGSDQHRRLARKYAEALGEVAQSEAWFQETMVAYGRYLRANAVPPEHIVICVRYALEHARLRQYSDERPLANRALGWAIAGYYEDRET